ncbi:SpoIIE family protein phosphatase [Mycobacterium yunnanensis]|uniref:SpoIIE family protein phosphatase n=1 Tax=Mycobacterium yunnanensis TaxID=368477 RepID=A0A9X2YXB8_9MYCO|nr:SpoIIE family protein phosphatase [Mycobacterium yunnanensis]MCV7419366.1 SpoIIE family protein phosphatase [Mycobacterium yunnanensis]
MSHQDFGPSYAAALRRHLESGGEESLLVGRDLGRTALQDRLSVTDIVECHFQLSEDLPAAARPAALRFLQQTLAAVDAASRGYVDGAERYEQQRARVDDLELRNAFRTALVNSLQEGFFVVDRSGTIVEINDAFAAITGCGHDGLPYRWPYPWLVDQKEAGDRLAQLVERGSIAAQTPIRHRDGRVSWAEVSINSVTADVAEQDAYVGTIRDVTAARASAARERAVVRLATAVGIATSVAEVLDIVLEELRAVVDLTRVVAVMWTRSGADPEVQVAGSADAIAWGDLDPFLAERFTEARDWPPLSVQAIGTAGPSGPWLGIMAVLSGVTPTALWLELAEARMIGDDDRLLVTTLVGHLSLAVQHVRQFEIAREASHTLQRTMMPTTKPPVGFAVRYEPAASPLEIGGDWYDVLAVGDHHVGIVVGDCVGSGLSAAAVMGQLRSSARVLLVNGVSPGRLLDELDSAAAVIAGAYCTTVFVGLVDADTGHMSYSSAGHIPALLAAPGEPAQSLTGATSVPLAVQKSGPRPEASSFLPPGSTLMLYTDGLVERRDELVDDGIERAGQVLAETIESTADVVADAVLSRLMPADGFDDDVAIVVYRRPPAPLKIDVLATPDQLSDIRHQIAAWLRATGIPDDLGGDIVLVVNEACTNSIEHAYREMAPGRMVVCAEAKGRGISIRIDDFGSWKLPDANPRTRGRGVPLMRAVSGDVTLDGTPTGTVVTLNFELS